MRRFPSPFSVVAGFSLCKPILKGVVIQDLTHSKERGFQLIELLMVMVILTLLSALLLPLFHLARARAYQTACTSHLRQITSAFLAYTNDWDGGFPLHPLPDPSSAGGRTWYTAIAPYVRSQELFICPANFLRTFSYSYNAWIAQPDRYAGVYRRKPTQPDARLLSEILDPSKTILLFDVPNDDPSLRGPVGEHDVLGEEVRQIVEGSFPGERDLVEEWVLLRAQKKGREIPDWVWPRHFRGNNISFVDGHVRWFKRLDQPYSLPES